MASRTQDETELVWVNLNRLIQTKATLTTIEEEKTSLKRHLGLSEVGFDYYRRELQTANFPQTYDSSLSCYTAEEKRGIELAQAQKELKIVYNKVSAAVSHSQEETPSAEQEALPEAERQATRITPYPNFAAWALARHKSP